jgi:pimeloyl-ACP methyl ester carboxylesterase
MRRGRCSIVTLALFLAASTGLLTGLAAGGERIDEVSYVALGGIEQFVTIHGDNRSNPILLLVHGGPADVQSPFRTEYSVYEHDFTLVQWDQRGAGKTFERYNDKTPNVTLAQIVADGVELAQYLSRHLGQKNIFILGHSWGSVVGVGMAQRQPDLFAAFIGTGQVGSWDGGVGYQKDFARRKASEAGNEDAVRAIDNIKQFDPTNIQHFLTVNRVLRGYLGKPDADWLSSIRQRTERSATPAEAQAIGAGMNFSGPALGPDMIRENLFATATRFQTPVYVIQGRNDVFAPTPVAIEYFRAIQAPSKQLFIIEGAGHFALVTHPKDFLKILRKIVRDLQNRSRKSSRNAGDRQLVGGGDGYHSSP